MINLIPIEEKKKIRKDFYYRFFVLFFIMLGLLTIVLIVATLPAYFISLEKKISINSRLEIQKNEVMPELDQQAQTELKDLDAKLSLLDKAKRNKYVFSQKVVSEIISKKITGIKINRITYDNDSLEGRVISVSGLAQNRETLLLFRKALEEDNSFKNVDLPISNFVKGTDIEFSLNLISI